ncbi:Calcium-binding protein 39 [Phytophthora cinnamomi]|uniref:Calcium-binding protein 39 n=1 Tax=Phytophthora cinnamomi TaxID=4785 RepID=UPI003559D210|nr:Calcium-binding protein 39 [Phytophthora cinnamomi]
MRPLSTRLRALPGLPGLKRRRRRCSSASDAPPPALLASSDSDSGESAPRRLLPAASLSLLAPRRLRRRRPRSLSPTSVSSVGSVCSFGSSSAMAATMVPAPPYMLGERPTPAHGGSGAPSFRQVPFVRASERVESGVKVRKQLRKYLKAASATQHMVAQSHLSDACLPALQPQEVAQSCFQEFFTQMRTYNQVLGNKHLAASKAYLDMTKPLENSGKSKRWARDVYNLVQRCVTDVQVAEKKMDKARLRVSRAADELAHWKTVLEANEATYQVQPNNPEVKRAFQLAQYRFSNAFGEDEAAGAEYDDARTMLLSAIARRDEVVEEASELSQSVEEDRLDTLLIVIGQFVETKVAILQAEIEAMADLQRTLKAMDRDSVVQQYIVDSMAPELTHRHAKALSLMEWHRVSWRYEQQSRQAAEPASYIAVAGSQEDIAKLKASGVSEKDVEVIKDFVSSCFVDPEAALLPSVIEGSTTASYVGSVRDLEEMKIIASTVVGEEGDESWENLFGASASASTAAGDEPTPSILGIDDEGSDASDKHKDKLMKRRKNSRKFNDQLRLARSIPLSLRIHEEEATAAESTAVSGKSEQKQPPLPPGPPPPSSVPILLRPRSTDNVFVAAREEAGYLPPTHRSNIHSLRHDHVFATDENGSVKSERRRHRKLHKARSVASIDTSMLRAENENEQVFNSSRSAASPATGMDQIKTIAARMKQRRKENSNGSIDFVALTRAQSDATESASASAGASKDPPTPEKKQETTLSGVAALRARFENK